MLFRLRPYQSDDAIAIATLFYETVHQINQAHYTTQQLNVWAPNDQNVERWNERLKKNKTWVVEDRGEIIGFGDLDETGYLDHLYVHYNYIRKGIGGLIARQLENEARTLGITTVTTHASITARPFFEARGYEVVQFQEVTRKGISLKNYKMKKTL